MISKQIQRPFDEVLEDIRILLPKYWFWIVSEVDLQAKLKEKLDQDIEPYLILWACNPTLASKVLSLDYTAGIFFPCNITLFQKEGSVTLNAVPASQTLWIIENRDINSIALEVEEKLRCFVEEV